MIATFLGEVPPLRLYNIYSRRTRIAGVLAMADGHDERGFWTGVGVSGFRKARSSYSFPEDPLSIPTMRLTCHSASETVPLRK